MPSDGIPYPIFSYTALLPWGLFAKALADAGRSLVANRSMITKVYFPRLVIPLASVLSGLVDFAHRFPGPDRDDDRITTTSRQRLPGCDHAGYPDAAVIPAAGAGHCPGRRPVALGAERACTAM